MLCFEDALEKSLLGTNLIRTLAESYFNLTKYESYDLLVEDNVSGDNTAASGSSGIISSDSEVCRTVHSFGALSIWPWPSDPASECSSSSIGADTGNNPAVPLLQFDANASVSSQPLPRSRKSWSTSPHSGGSSRRGSSRRDSPRTRSESGHGTGGGSDSIDETASGSGTSPNSARDADESGEEPYEGEPDDLDIPRSVHNPNPDILHIEVLDAIRAVAAASAAATANAAYDHKKCGEDGDHQDSANSNSHVDSGATAIQCSLRVPHRSVLLSLTQMMAKPEFPLVALQEAVHAVWGFAALAFHATCRIPSMRTHLRYCLDLVRNCGRQLGKRLLARMATPMGDLLLNLLQEELHRIRDRKWSTVSNQVLTLCDLISSGF
jgi:hypothetical protein